MIYKRCNVCSEVKLICQFGKDRQKVDGHAYICRACNRAKTGKWQQDNRERSNAYRRNRYFSDLERLERRRAENRRHNKDKYHKDIAASRASQNAYKKSVADKTRQWSKTNRKKNYPKILALNAERRAKQMSATPCWLTKDQKTQSAWFYAAAQMMSDTSGVPHHVDHIHPLQGKNFCGLHVPWNLQVLPASSNIAKNNNLPNDERHLLWEAA